MRFTVTLPQAGPTALARLKALGSPLILYSTSLELPDFGMLREATTGVLLRDASGESESRRCYPQQSSDAEQCRGACKAPRPSRHNSLYRQG